MHLYEHKEFTVVIDKKKQQKKTGVNKSSKFVPANTTLFNG